MVVFDVPIPGLEFIQCCFLKTLSLHTLQALGPPLSFDSEKMRIIRVKPVYSILKDGAY